MTPAIPDATLSDNPLARAVETAQIAVEHLGPLARHLDELIASNVASTKLMAHRHATTALADFHLLSHHSEQEAHRLLQPFVRACTAREKSPSASDALALAYPAQIARIAVTGTAWDYPVTFLHLCRASTLSYRMLRTALEATGGFTDQELEHFTYFGHVDDDEIAATHALLGDVPPDVLERACEAARHLAVFEELFWQRMVAVCTPATPS